MDNNNFDNEWYQRMLEQRDEKELERARKYNCDGLCYGCHFMCPRVDTCPETRLKEGFGFLLGLLIMGFVWLICIVAVIGGVFLAIQFIIYVIKMIFHL